MTRTTAMDVVSALAPWPVSVTSVTPLRGGWNSTTWLVTASGQRFVAKLVDQLDAEGLIAGLRLAEFAASRGLACGAPVRTTRGELTAALADGVLALLRHAPGTPPDLSVPDQVRRAGRVLAQAHQVLADYPAGDDPRYRWPWEWVAKCLDTIAMPAEIREAARTQWARIVAAVAEHQLSISLIHSDPGPEGFLLSDDSPAGRAGQDAIIDWATPMRGPLLYDLASFAVVTRSHGPQVSDWLTEGYLEVMPQIEPELPRLPSLVRARWLAHAIYFAARIERGITRGGDSPTANADGLAAAYDGLTS